MGGVSRAWRRPARENRGETCQQGRDAGSYGQPSSPLLNKGPICWRPGLGATRLCIYSYALNARRV